MREEKVEVNPMNILFAKVMKICTLIGLIVMIVCGFLYLVGIGAYLNVSSIVEHWGKPAALFWKEAKGLEISGYWFLPRLAFMDSLSMVGICLLALTPLISVVLLIPKSKKIYTILFSTLAAEFIFSIIRPLI